jgi:hypothetical protein
MRIVTLLIILLVIAFWPVNVLVLEHYQTGEILKVFIVSPGEEFTTRWIHSVELTPWEEVFVIGDNYQMILDRTRFKQFGAGVPDQAGTKTEIKDGYIIFSGINQEIQLLPLGISAFAQHTLIMDSHELLLYEIVPDGDRINFYTDRLTFGSFLISKLTLK